jgi:hypothetical protein
MVSSGCPLKARSQQHRPVHALRCHSRLLLVLLLLLVGSRGTRLQC